MNMYVSNLGFHTTDDDLRKLFESYGRVSSAKVIMDKGTGQSRGFGFVEMSSETESKQAIENLNGQQMEGKRISVSVAKERKSW